MGVLPTTSDPVEALAAVVRSEAQPITAQVDAACAVVNLWLRRRVHNAEDREELALDAVRRLIRAVEQGKLHADRPAGPWLRVVANHLAIDRLRQRSPSVALEFDEHVHVASEDDRLARLLDRDAAARDVWRALREAGEAGEHETVKIVAVWLALASQLGATTYREVGDSMGISHMTVQRAMKRFAARLSR